MNPITQYSILRGRGREIESHRAAPLFRCKGALLSDLDFFFGNPNLTLDLWKVISGISEFDD